MLKFFGLPTLKYLSQCGNSHSDGGKIKKFGLHLQCFMFFNQQIQTMVFIFFAIVISTVNNMHNKKISTKNKNKIKNKIK